MKSFSVVVPDLFSSALLSVTVDVEGCSKVIIEKRIRNAIEREVEYLGSTPCGGYSSFLVAGNTVHFKGQLDHGQVANVATILWI